MRGEHSGCRERCLRTLQENDGGAGKLREHGRHEMRDDDEKEAGTERLGDPHGTTMIDKPVRANERQDARRRLRGPRNELLPKENPPSAAPVAPIAGICALAAARVLWGYI